MKVAVTGATGVVGRFVVARLQAEGVAIRALVRRTSNRGGLPADIETIVGDMTDEKALASLVEGVDAVVHCAYAHAPGRYRGGEADDVVGFWQSNLLPGLALMECARRARVERLVVMSSRAVFGRQTPALHWLDDDMRPVPDTHYGALKLALEAHAGAFAATDGVCYASLRPTGVYGVTVPVARSKWFDLAHAVRHGEPLPAARLATEVHGRDVAAAVWLLLTAPAAHVAGRAFNCSDLVVDTRDVMAQLVGRMGTSAELPSAAANTISHGMRSPALDRLGWRPGGKRLLKETVDELASAIPDRNLCA